MDLLASRQLPMELPMHNVRPLHRRALLLGLTLVACDPAKLGTLDSEGTGSTGGDDADPSDTASDDAGSQSGPATSSTTSASTSGDDAETSPPDEGGPSESGETSATSSTTGDPSGDTNGVDGEPCDPFLQDCPDGEKCNPWANDGGTAWNADGCFPVDESAGLDGDPCLVEGSGTSGLDNCALGSMCWDVDAENNGTCVALCSGTPEEPVCEAPDTACAILNDGVLPVCLPVCDPLLQDCDDGEGCYSANDEFFCFPDGSGEAGLALDSCDFVATCDPGLACIDGDLVDGCDSAGCCTPYCDLTVPASCGGDSTCMPFFPDGQAPTGLEDIGYCS